MTSKWINELLTTGKLDREQMIAIADILNRVDELLKRSALAIDNEELHLALIKEVYNARTSST